MHDGPAYTAETRGILVKVRPSYLAGQSDPDAGRWVWAYHIEVVNLGTVPVRLTARHWTITDATGRVEQVRGPGVVGEQPLIAPGQAFDYASGCPLPTPSGTMVGTYTMTDDRGGAFEAAIPAFSLDVPGAARTIN